MDNQEYLILTINPGSTSTKVGVSRNETLELEIAVRHSVKMLEQFERVWDQYSFRKDEIVQALKQHGYKLSDFDAVVGRGGLIKPIPGGVYVIDEAMIQDARVGLQGQHASNLGCVIAYSIGWEYGVPAYIVDPPSVDELEPLARISGYAEIERSSLMHALNAFATARIFAKKAEKKLSELNLIVAHLGGGVTVSALRQGQAINVNNGIDEGPFTPERSGRLPLLKFMKMCLSGKYTEAQLRKIVSGRGGLTSYCNTNKATEIESMIRAGSEKYKLVYEAMAYQIAEEIGARATNLKGHVDAVIVTGGLAYSEMLTTWIRERVQFIAPVHIFPGELELEALADGALRVLRGQEAPKHYNVTKRKIGVFYWTELPLYMKAVRILEEVLKQNNYKFRTADSNLDIFYINCENSEERVQEAVNYFLDIDVDLVIAIGTQASVRAAQYLKGKNIDVICVGVYNGNVLTSIDWQQNKKFHAVCYAVGMEEHIENTIKRLTPDLKKIGMTYKLGELQSEIQYDELSAYCQKHNIELVTLTTPEPQDMTEAADFFTQKGVQWVILAADTIIAHANSQQLAPVTAKIPTLCTLEPMVIDAGVLMCYQASWRDVATEAAGLVTRLLEGETPEQQIIMPTSRKLLVNGATARKLNLMAHLEQWNDVRFVQG